MKQMEYTIKVVTSGTVDTDSLQNTIAGLEGYNILRVEITNFRIVKQVKS